MSSLEDGFGGGVDDDMVNANTGELRNPFWEGTVALAGTKRAETMGCSNCTMHDGHHHAPGSTTTCCRRLDPMCCMNLGLSLSGGE